MLAIVRPFRRTCVAVTRVSFNVRAPANTLILEQVGNVLPVNGDTIVCSDIWRPTRRSNIIRLTWMADAFVIAKENSSRSKLSEVRIFGDILCILVLQPDSEEPVEVFAFNKVGWARRRAFSDLIILSCCRRRQEGSTDEKYSVVHLWRRREDKNKQQTSVKIFVVALCS